MGVLFCLKSSAKMLFSFLEFASEFQGRTPVPVQNVSINSRRKMAV